MKKVLFIHISKTGGASIVKAPFVVVHGSPEVSPTIPVRDNEELDFSFTFVRDPYTRFSSTVLGHDFATPENFEEWTKTVFVEEIAPKIHDFNMMSKDQIFVPQYRYLVHEGGEMDVDFLGYFETLQKQWLHICAMAEQKFDLPHENKNKVPNHASYHTEETRRIVAEVYAKDFELLDYEI